MDDEDEPEPVNLYENSDSPEGRGAKREREQFLRWLRSPWAWMHVNGQPEPLSREFRERFAQRIEIGEHWKA